VDEGPRSSICITTAHTSDIHSLLVSSSKVCHCSSGSPNQSFPRTQRHLDSYRTWTTLDSRKLQYMILLHIYPVRSSESFFSPIAISHLDLVSIP
jgi:hypothetical protein